MLYLQTLCDHEQFGIPPGTRTPTNSFGDCDAAITPARYVWWTDGGSNPDLRLAKPMCSHYHYQPISLTHCCQCVYRNTLSLKVQRRVYDQPNMLRYATILHIPVIAWNLPSGSPPSFQFFCSGTAARVALPLITKNPRVCRSWGSFLDSVCSLSYTVSPRDP